MCRYSLKIGKFGHYFYDIKKHKDLTLLDVLQILNKCNMEYIELVKRVDDLNCKIDDMYKTDDDFDDDDSFLDGIESEDI